MLSGVNAVELDGMAQHRAVLDLHAPFPIHITHNVYHRTYPLLAVLHLRLHLLQVVVVRSARRQHHRELAVDNQV